MFGTFMIFIFLGYAGWYGYNMIKDAYFDKSAVVVEDAVEESEVDIGDELKDFTQYDANEEDKLAYARKQAEAEAAKKAAEEALQRQSEKKGTDDTFSNTNTDGNIGGSSENTEKYSVASMNGGIEVDNLSNSLSEWERQDQAEFNQLMDCPIFAKKIKFA